MNSTDPLFAPMKDSSHREVAGVTLDICPVGSGRVKRLVYPPGFRWSTHMKSVVGTPWCQHAHVGFLAHGEVHIEFPDGCKIELKAPQAVSIEPGHDGWVVGNQPAVMIEFDFEGQTTERFGMPPEHRHTA